jgi:hypothetical protein
MPCTPFNLGNGVTGVICTRGRGAQRDPCSVPGCGRPHTKLCDYPLVPLEFGKEPKTCDAKICDRCAVHVGPNCDYCPPHSRVAKPKEP